MTLNLSDIPTYLLTSYITNASHKVSSALNEHSLEQAEHEAEDLIAYTSELIRRIQDHQVDGGRFR